MARCNCSPLCRRCANGPCDCNCSKEQLEEYDKQRASPERKAVSDERERLIRKLDERFPDESWAELVRADATLRAQLSEAQATLRAAAHALRAYQYGNSDGSLAQSMADKIDAALARSTPAQGKEMGK